jgi:parallel beta-helix repeat protein
MFCKLYRFSSVSVILFFVLLTVMTDAAQGDAKTITVCTSGCAFTKIQPALDAAMPGDTVLVSTGVYREFLRIKKTVILATEGSVTVRAPSENTLPQPVITLDGAKDVRLNGFSITGSALAGVSMNGGSALLENNTLSDNTLGILISKGASVTLSRNKIGDGILVKEKSVLTALHNTIQEGSGDGILIINSSATLRENEISQFEANGVALKANSSMNLIQNTIAANKASGVEVSDASEATLEGNTISQNAYAGIMITAGRAKITGNQLTANEWGVRVGGSAEIRDNRIQQSRWCAIWAEINAQVTGNPNQLRENGAELCGPVPLGLRQSLAVQTSRSQVSVPSDFRTVQEAIDAVAPGGTVVLAAGAFSTPIGIYKNITLRGSPGTILEGNKKIGIVIASGATKVSLQNLTVRNGLVGIRIEAGGSEISITLDQISVSANEQDGLQIRSTVLVSIQKSTFSANSALCSDLAGCAALSVGRRGATDGLVSTSARVHISNSAISQNEGHGVALSDATLSLIEDTNIEQNKRSGLDANGGAQAQLRNVSFTQNDYGIRALEKARLSLNNVKLSLQRFEGIRLDGREVQIEILASEARQNRGSGMLALGGAQLVVRDSKFIANSQWGISLQASGRATFEKISLLENLLGGTTLSSLETVTVSQSEITGNKGTAVQVNGTTKIELKANLISSNEGKQTDGIALFNSVQALLQENRIAGNGRNGVLAGERAMASLVNNQITNNVWWGVTTYTKNCLPDDAQIPDKFSGAVTGSGNTIDANLKGDLCGVTGLR